MSKKRHCPCLLCDAGLGSSHPTCGAQLNERLLATAQANKRTDDFSCITSPEDRRAKLIGPRHEPLRGAHSSLKVPVQRSDNNFRSDGQEQKGRVQGSMKLRLSCNKRGNRLETWLLN